MLALLILFTMVLCIVEAQVFSMTKSDTNVKYAIYSLNSQTMSTSSIALVIGVGTAMSISDYSEIATAIVTANPNVIAIIMDHNPNNIVKLDEKKFANGLDKIYSFTKASINPIFRLTTWYVGGHSASGQAVAQAFIKNLWGAVFPVGSVLLDPFASDKKYFQGFNITSLIWQTNVPSCGFQNCGVCPASAGQGLYDAAIGGDEACNNYAFYEFTDPGVKHCIYTNGGCLFMCGGTGSVSRGITFQNIADSIGKFIAGAFQIEPHYSNADYSTKKACL
jgi:hypothetical protein